MKSFSQKIFKLGINPCVNVPENVLKELFKEAGKSKGPFPVRGTLNGKRFLQTVVKYQGAWRLYLNGQMRLDARIDVGDIARIEIEFDPKLARALSKNAEAKGAFARLTPSHQKEISRYLNSLKSEESVIRNVEKVLLRLIGKKVKGRNALVRS